MPSRVTLPSWYSTNAPGSMIPVSASTGRRNLLPGVAQHGDTTLPRRARLRLLEVHHRGIGCGQIDIVVVYKIDRLTRSLADFSKMVEVFERHGVSFVSVTQQFNTTSMGRLMLNVLLSFA